MGSLGPFGFIGGLNTKASALTLPKDQMSDSQDVVISYGNLVKRNGSTALNGSAFASGAAFHGLFDWQTAAGQRYLVATAGTKIGQMADLGGTFTDITSSATITTGANNLHTFASLNNILGIFGGTTPDTPLQWTGTGNVSSLSGSPPTGNLGCTANNFMFISGVAANPSRVYWSNVIDPNTWTSTNYADFRASDGDKVTCLLEKDQNLLIFKRRSMGQLWTNTISVSGAVTLGPLNQINAGIGCPGPLCADRLPDGRVVFLGTNAHVYIWDGAGFTDISDAPLPASNIQPNLDGLNVARLQYASVKVYSTKNQIWITASNGSSTTNNMVFVYDYQYQIWLSKFMNVNANVMYACIDTRATPTYGFVMVTGNYSGTCYIQDKGTTNPEASNTVIDGYGTISLQLGPDDKDFIPASALVSLEQQGNYNLEVNWGYDGLTEVSKSKQVSQLAQGAGLDNFRLDTDVLQGPNLIRRTVRLLGNGRSSSIQLQFRNRLSGQAFSVKPVFISDEVMI